MDTSVPMLTDENGKPKPDPLNDSCRTPNLETHWARGSRFFFEWEGGMRVPFIAAWANALCNTLAAARIAETALDCFENEPIATPHRFGELDNVLPALHSIAWSHEPFRDIGRTACQALLDLSCGRRALRPVNPEVFDKVEFVSKWDPIRQ